MRYGVLGDIHANLSALAAVLQRCEEEGVDRLISVGDVVGYGAAPQECIAILRERDAVVVKGNHDAACVGELDDRCFNNYAREAVQWTRTVLNARERLWLQSLPMTVTLEHCEVSHGSLARPEDYNYVQSIVDADPSLEIMERPVCFVGHTHVPIALIRPKSRPGRTGYTYETEIDLQDCYRVLLNVGSVGQPRDEDPRTAYAIYDSDQQMAWINRIEYDIEREAHRIRSAGLPRMLAERLFLGL